MIAIRSFLLSRECEPGVTGCLLQMICFSKRSNNLCFTPSTIIRARTRHSCALTRFLVETVLQCFLQCLILPSNYSVLDVDRPPPSGAGTRPSNSSAARPRRLLVGTREGVINTAPRDHAVAGTT